MDSSLKVTSYLLGISNLYGDLSAKMSKSFRPILFANESMNPAVYLL